MLKLYKDQKVSIWKIQKDLGLDKMRLYRYATGVVDIERIPTKLVLDLAYYLKIEPNKLMRDMVDYLKK